MPCISLVVSYVRKHEVMNIRKYVKLQFSNQTDCFKTDILSSQQNMHTMHCVFL